MSKIKGTFIWHDLITTNIPLAQAFYGNVFNWTMTPFDTSPDSYIVISVGGSQIGGMMSIPGMQGSTAVAASWSGYIAVDDVDDCVRQVLALGGSLQRGPEDVPNVGRLAVVGDPQGAIFIVMRGANPDAMTPRIPESPGFISWNELHTSDPSSAFRFYSDLFGWEEGDAADMGSFGIYQPFAANGVDEGGIMAITPGMTNSFWLFYVNVDDVLNAIQRIKAAGGSVLSGPQQAPKGNWIAQCLDPEGGSFAVIGPLPVRS